VKNLLGVSRYREEDKIKTENEIIEWGGHVELINLVQDSDRWWAVCKRCNETWNIVKFREFLG
jgi:hypothetical protein